MAGCDFNPRWFWTSGNIKSVLKIFPELEKPVFHVCSGVSWIGDIRLDRSIIISESLNDRDDRRGSPNFRGDMCNLPFKSSIAGSVICDPPYRHDFTEPELISELVRICKPGAKIVFIAPWIPNHKLIEVISTELWNVGSNGAYFKIRTLFRKSGTSLDDFK